MQADAGRLEAFEMWILRRMEKNQLFSWIHKKTIEEVLCMVPQDMEILNTNGWGMMILEGRIFTNKPEEE